MPHRELVVIRTHDSLITPVVFQEHSTRSGCSRGRVISSDCADRPEVEVQDGQHSLGLGHKVDAINNRMCIVFLVVSAVGLLKRLFITVSQDEQTYAK